jgi:ferredoxin-NADP reductase
MAGTAVRGRLTWLIAQVIEIVDENPTVRSIVLDCPGWPGHLPGQHIDIRLTAEDGYQAQRSYSIATPADGERVTLTVETVDGGEVSPFLVEELRFGDRIEIRGPIGGYFVWRPTMSSPLLLVGGGSGVVPLMAMLRARSQSASTVPVHYLASGRTRERLIYFEESTRISDSDGSVVVVHTLTRSHPDGWTGPTRRIDREMLEVPGFMPTESPDVFVCGPTGFVESVAATLVDIGHEPGRVRTERFGPSGG